MQKQLSTFIALLLATCLLGACGFHLRGSGNSATLLPEEWKSMALVTGNPNSEFSRELVARFAIAGVQWADRQSANYVLVLGPERFSQRNLSLSAEARAAEFELTMRADFSVLGNDQGEVIPNTTASVIKQMENDPRNVVGKAEEIRLLQTEMRAELSQQIMRRIGFFAAIAAAQTPSD
jgi:LPS-assembly lipoprotein